MNKIAQVIIILCLVPHLAWAQAECADKPECWPEGSAMHTGLLLVEKQKKAELALARKHEALIQLVSSSSANGINVDGRLLAALKTQQVAWLKYRAEECELIGALTGAGGSWPATYASQCAMNHLQLRLRRIGSAIACIEKIAVDRRIFEQNRCLQQLAPLTNRM